jgi:hypothetical protein
MRPDVQLFARIVRKYDQVWRRTEIPLAVRLAVCQRLRLAAIKARARPGGSRIHYLQPEGNHSVFAVY